MRIRSVKPDYLTDRVTGRWSLELQMFYIALWCFADDDGRFEWEPDLIRCQLFPFHRDLDVEALLGRLVESGRVVRYEVTGVTYGAIPTFTRHQHPDKKRESTLPPPPRRVVPDSSPPPPRPVPAGGEGRGEEGIGGAEPPAPRPKPDGMDHQAVIDTFARLWLEVRGGDPYPVAGGKDGRAVKDLLRACPAAGNSAEVETRVRRYLADPWCAKNGGLAHFCSRWAGLDGAGRGVHQVVAPAAPASAFGKGGVREIPR